MKNINTVYLYFQATVKKLAEFLDSSATPETSSMTISLSHVVFSSKILFTFLFSVSSDLDIFLNSSSKSFKIFWSCRWWNLTGHAKQDSISASLSFVNLIYETHLVFFSLPKKVIYCKFLCKKCFSTYCSSNSKNISYKFSVINLIIHCKNFEFKM